MVEGMFACIAIQTKEMYLLEIGLGKPLYYKTNECIIFGSN